MDYSFIFRQLQVILSNNRISLIPLGFVLLNFVLVIVSRTFRKAGLFVLALAFGIDYAIKSLPFDLYYNVPWLYNAVTVLYILGFLIFFLKVLKMVIRISNTPAISNKSNSKLSQFLNFTGLMPFIIMLLINFFNYNEFIPVNYLTILTSISFVFMLAKTIYSTYKYLETKESIIIADKMDFDEIKEFLKDDRPIKAPNNSKNAGRRVRKPSSESAVLDPTETIDIEEVKKVQKVRVKEVNEKTTEVKPESNNTQEVRKSLSNTDLIKLISANNENLSNETTMSITNLKTLEVQSYTSTRPKLRMHEHDEYKVDLEFERVNEYDYGKFIDLLLAYSRNKELYKFELSVKPIANPTSKIIFFDPSNVYDIDDSDYANVGGKIISMNFPKYKINFITGN